MKRMKKLVIVLIIAVFFVIAYEKYGNEEARVKEYYAIEDFKAIIIGDSSFKDVYEIAPIDSVQITSYGGFCEYPTENGGCIRIKFRGKELVVISIEEESD